MGLTLIKALTATTSPATTSLTFVDGTSDVVFDNTYNEYKFYYVIMHPQNSGDNFEFQVNATDDAGGDYDTSLITNTYFNPYHNEAGTDSNLGYSDGNDLAQSANHCRLTHNIDDDGRDGCSGVLTIYEPSSPTYVKHFMARTNSTHHSSEYTMDSFTAGYINDTTPIDEIRFRMSSGNIDAGTIYMYGVS